MQEEKQHHHLFHHNKEEEKKPVEAVVHSETAYGVDGAGQCYETTETVGYATTQPDFEKGRKPHQRKEHLGELGNVTTGPIALYQKHQAKKDEMHTHMNKLEEEIGTAVTMGGGGYAFLENHEKKESKHA
ncbi:abscisic stress-ripening protein 2-like [Primulina huaijiensis]|uniref:abscisic stress-ripening protein 2-like n=1 Tax=Primulina huaijiensis TaxID=1492673 RepID=UPI003CC6F39A